jgi:hypothetical protein
MKSKWIILFLMLFSVNAFSQENAITISGGYAFANIEDADAKGTGWRINGLYEFSMMDGRFAHGFAAGYIGISATDEEGLQTTESHINSFPVYYAPKFMFGNEKVKGFVKGALGMQIAGLKREGLVTVTDSDMGFYGGGGVGILFFIRENIFINVEYEIAWASNSFYKDGWMNTAMGGIGFKF